MELIPWTNNINVIDVSGVDGLVLNGTVCYLGVLKLAKVKIRWLIAIDDKLEKYLLILLIFLFGILNIGIALTTTVLILDFNMLIKEQLIEIVAIILISVLFNYALLSVYKDE